MYEIYVDIKGYENSYQISNSGNVISFPRQGTQVKRPKEIKQHLNNCGYKMVALSKDNKIKWHFVHKLVAQHFISNKDNKPCVNHIDGDKLNNHYKNLEFCTYGENLKHAYKNGLRKPTNQYLK